MAGEMIFLHPLVGAQGDNHRDCRRPIPQRLVRRAHQQRQGARTGAVRDHEANPLPIQIRSGELITNEGTDLLGRQPLADTTHKSGSGRITWIGPITSRSAGPLDSDSHTVSLPVGARPPQGTRIIGSVRPELYA
jgi:hypothetical protein